MSIYIVEVLTIGLVLASCFQLKRKLERLGSLTTDTTGQLDVLWHDGNALGVDGAQVGVFEETDEVSLRCFL